MADVVINTLVEGGKATGGAALGPTLGPLGINMNNVIAEINKQTKDFDGVKVPVKIIVNPSTKTFTIEVGFPPTSALILKELGIAKGAKNKEEVVGNITIEQAKKIAKMKEEKLYGNTVADRVKQILGTCTSMNITCEGISSKEMIAKINSGEVKVE